MKVDTIKVVAKEFLDIILLEDYNAIVEKSSRDPFYKTILV